MRIALGHRSVRPSLGSRAVVVVHHALTHEEQHAHAERDAQPPRVGAREENAAERYADDTADDQREQDRAHARVAQRAPQLQGEPGADAKREDGDDRHRFHDRQLQRHDRHGDDACTKACDAVHEAGDEEGDRHEAKVGGRVRRLLRESRGNLLSRRLCERCGRGSLRRRYPAAARAIVTSALVSSWCTVSLRDVSGLGGRGGRCEEQEAHGDASDAWTAHSAVRAGASPRRHVFEFLFWVHHSLGSLTLELAFRRYLPGDGLFGSRYVIISSFKFVWACVPSVGRARSPSTLLRRLHVAKPAAPTDG